MFEKVKDQLYIALISFTLFVAVAFTYMTYIFWSNVQETKYEIWTYLIASPILFSIILFFALIFIGKKQVIQELSEFLTGSRN